MNPHKPKETMAQIPPSGVYQLSSIACAICSRADDKSFLVNLDGMTGKEEILKAFGKACLFPEWYGANFDALYDCLTDWSEGNYVVCIDRSTAWQQADPEAYGTFRQIIEDVCASKQQANNRLHVFIDDETLPALPSVPPSLPGSQKKSQFVIKPPSPKKKKPGKND